MKILFLAPQPFYVDRGTPIAVRAAVNVLAELGHDIDLLTYFGGQDVEIEGVKIHRISRPPMVRHVPIGPSWQKIPCDVAMHSDARRMIRTGGYDVVHAVEEAGILAWLINRSTPMPYVFDMDSRMSDQITEKSPLLWPVGRLFSHLERAAIRDSAGVLAVCPALVEYAERFHPSGNVRLLPDIALPESPEEGETDEVDPCGLADMPGGKVLYVGNLEPYQGIDILLEGFRRASRRCDTTLVIIGGSSERIAYYRRMSEDLCEAGRVHFLGPRPLSALRAILASADILASPRSKGINTPMKIYNYMASGKAILATRMLTHMQVLDDSTACLVPPTAEGMAEGIERLVTRPVLRAQLGRDARATVQSDYGIARFRQRLSDFYGGLTLGAGRALIPGGMVLPDPPATASESTAAGESAS